MTAATHPPAIIICGFDELVRQVLDTLLQFGQTALVIDPKPPSQLPEGIRFFEGDYRTVETLKAAGVEKAKVVMILKSDDQITFETLLLVSDLNPSARIISRLFDQNLAQHIDENLPAHFTLSTSMLSAPAFGFKAVSDEFIGYFSLPPLRPKREDPRQRTDGGHHSAHQGSQDDSIWNIVDLTIGPTSKLLRMPLYELEDTFGVRVLFHYPLDYLADFSPIRAFEDFDHKAELLEGDRVVVICSPQKYLKLLDSNDLQEKNRTQAWATREFEDGESASDHQPSPLTQRFTRGWLDLKERIQKVSPLTRFLVLTIISMLMLGILVFVAIGEDIIDAIFLTVTVLSGGFGDVDVLMETDTPAWAKLVAASLMVMGTVLIGLVYGFMADRLLSSRFGLGKAGVIPKAGHVVIAHLGRLSFRILQLLRQLGYEVVVIEPDESHQLIEAARQEGVAVIHGDPTLTSTLERVRIATCACLICATRTDMLNVETALAAQALQPGLRTLLRIANPRLAERMQRHLQSIGVSYSPDALSAPAFATAALVGPVFGTFVWEGQTLLVNRWDIAAHSPHVGTSLWRLVHDYDLLILTFQSQTQPEIIFPKVWEEAGEIKLRAGDQMYVLATMESLSRLARKRPLPQEVYRVKLLDYANTYFTDNIAEAIAFFSRRSTQRVRPLLDHLPRIVSPPLQRDVALKLARQLAQMTADVRVFSEVASGQEGIQLKGFRHQDIRDQDRRTQDKLHQPSPSLAPKDRIPQLAAATSKASNKPKILTPKVIPKIDRPDPIQISEDEWES